jgi:hypothetical protein
MVFYRGYGKAVGAAKKAIGGGHIWSSAARFMPSMHVVFDRERRER